MTVIRSIEEILTVEHVECPYCGEHFDSKKWVHECPNCGGFFRLPQTDWQARPSAEKGEVK